MLFEGYVNTIFTAVVSEPRQSRHCDEKFAPPVECGLVAIRSQNRIKGPDTQQSF
jgi:hypothetical protein